MGSEQKMRFRDALELLLLASLWGASFLFMRVAGPEFGPIALSLLRAVIAAPFTAAFPAVAWRACRTKDSLEETRFGRCFELRNSVLPAGTGYGLS